MKYFLSIYFVVYVFALGAQNNDALQKQIDSLKQAVKNAKSDTSKIAALVDWDNLIFLSDPELDYQLNLQIEALCIKNLKRKLNATERLIFKRRYAGALNNLGIVYRLKGNLSKAIVYLDNALNLNEELGNKAGAMNALTNIGTVHQDQKAYNKAIGYYKQSLKIARQINKQQAIPNLLNNIGTCYSELVMYDEAIEIIKQSIDVSRQIQSKWDEANAIGSLATLSAQKGNLNKGIELHLEAKKLHEEINNYAGVSSSLIGIGYIYLQKNQNQKTIEYCEEALKIAKQIDGIFQIEKASENLAAAYRNLKRYKEALDMADLYHATRDSINSENSKKELVRQEFQYAYEKKTATDSVKRADEKKLGAATLQNEQFKKYILYCGLVVLLLFGIFILNRLRLTRKQKSIIEEQKVVVEQQKLIVELKQREVIDSIHYAKRIQDALLTSERYFDRNLERLRPK